MRGTKGANPVNNPVISDLQENEFLLFKPLRLRAFGTAALRN